MQPKGRAQYIFNGTSWVPWAGTTPGFAGVVLHDATGNFINAYSGNADNVGSAFDFLLGTAGFGYLFDGTTWDRARNNSAANLSATTQSFAAQVAEPGEWSINHVPLGNVRATITRAAGAAGVRHVCRSISGTVLGLAAAAEATVILNLRDGATGAGTILWSERLLVQVSGQVGFAISGLNILGSAATAMTLEFDAAGGANTFESVALTGYDTV